MRRLNDRRETPVLITDDGRVLTETMAIARWLEVRDIERRISFDPGTPAADRMYQLMGFLNTGFTGAFSPLWVALEMESAPPPYRETLRDYGRKAVADRHAQLEAMIGDTSSWPATGRPWRTPFWSVSPAGPSSTRRSTSRHIPGWRRCADASRRIRRCASR